VQESIVIKELNFLHRKQPLIKKNIKILQKIQFLWHRYKVHGLVDEDGNYYVLWNITFGIEANSKRHLKNYLKITVKILIPSI